jgi:hypothetical protein
MRRTLLLFWVFLGCGIFGSMGLRAEDQPVEITRVKIDHYVATRPVRTEDPMIRFERRYLTWGAIGGEEFREREGKYFTVFWKARDPGAATIIRFEYLQAKTGRTVHVQEVKLEQAKRGNSSADFRVIGADYQDKGDVLAWKASVLRNGAVLAERRSFLWKDP